MGGTGRAQMMPSSAFDCPAAVYSCPSRSLQAASGRICSCASRASPHNHRPCSGPHFHFTGLHELPELQSIDCRLIILSACLHRESKGS